MCIETGQCTLCIDFINTPLIERDHSYSLWPLSPSFRFLIPSKLYTLELNAEGFFRERKYNDILGLTVPEQLTFSD